MGELTLNKTETASVEDILRDELARENRALSSVAPVISHMLEAAGQPLVNDATVACVRGMLNSLAAQLLTARAAPNPFIAPDNTAIDALADQLAQDHGLLDHLYSLTLEGQLTLELERKSATDPVLSPLLQELIASDQPAIAELAMTTLAAQSRFLQSHRRMEHSLVELPPDLFESVIATAKKAGVFAKAGKDALAPLGADYDEGASRLGLLARLVSSLKNASMAALELEHAGLALFASALATITQQNRESAVLSCHERHAARLALGLRAAGLEGSAIERQFALVGPAQIASGQLAAIAPDKALQVLKEVDAGAGR